MTTFDDRDKSFENKFAHDEELAFKINARRNKLLGLWAAGKLGKQGQEAETYARDLVLADFEIKGDSDVTDKLIKDFAQGGIRITLTEIRAEMERLLQVAKNQVMGGDTL